MNQAIQFPDREEWDADLEAVSFPALVNGMQLMCAIKGNHAGASLWRRYARTVVGRLCEHRWDLEEEAEALIQSQQEDDQGWVWLS